MSRRRVTPSLSRKGGWAAASVLKRAISTEAQLAPGVGFPMGDRGPSHLRPLTARDAGGEPVATGRVPQRHVRTGAA